MTFFFYGLGILNGRLIPNTKANMPLALDSLTFYCLAQTGHLKFYNVVLELP